MPYTEDITLVIPTHPARSRNGMLDRALRSVTAQTLLPSRVIIENDRQRAGACATRNRGLAAVTTPWVAFLDSDDELLPQHLEHLMATAKASHADLVYPWFDLIGGADPFPDFNRPFDPARLKITNYIPVTVLARTQLVKRVGGFTPVKGSAAPCEDWGCWLRMVDAGAHFVHHPERTWRWQWHGANTAGRPDQGDALTADLDF
ncbi:glycosyltransferase family 2 protein [Streptomyces sp. WZ-12]|uniref:glycosyltransferase family 2 protein n=1 Tax=Streptomyces sp. WZ-12 TaxID=3030210 RepID=UPI0023817FA1|nr:glycosyltransferase family A protein [Streptomyces sp. WZ-12]